MNDLIEFLKSFSALILWSDTAYELHTIVLLLGSYELSGSLRWKINTVSSLMLVTLNKVRRSLISTGLRLHDNDIK